LFVLRSVSNVVSALCSALLSFFLFYYFLLFLLFQDLAEISSRLRDFQTALDGAQLELKHLGAHVQKNEFTKLLRDHKHTLKELKNEYEWRKANSDKNQLMDGARPAATGADMTTQDGLMKHGLDVQAAGTSSLGRTLRVVEETKQIGIDTVAKLEANTHQIEAMYGECENGCAQCAWL
jgi:hypothetical protein